MKKIVAVMATTLIVPALVTAAAAPASAKAAPRDPAAAVKLQYAKKSGVRLDDSLRMTLGKDVLLRGRVSGLVRFGPGGVNAFDLKASAKVADVKFDSHSIASGKFFYVKAKELTKELPEGKKWVRVPVSAAPVQSAASANLINVLDAKVLKAVLATVKTRMPGGRVGGAQTVLYRGAISLRQLGKVSENAREIAKILKGQKVPAVTWRLWVGRDNLPRRFTTTAVLFSDPKAGKATLFSDSRFSGWGTRTTVKAPPAAQVIDVKDLDSGEELAEIFSGQVLVPFGDPYKGLATEK